MADRNARDETARSRGFDRADADRLYAEGRELGDEARLAFVESACGDEPELRAEVLSLLDEAEAAEAFFRRLQGRIASSRPGVGPRASPPGAEAASGEPRRPHADRLPPDTTVGRYRIGERIGAGGMGTVYRARDSKLQRDVALKLLPPDLAADPRARERFLREARAAAALDHPNICTIHEIGEMEDGRPFIAMALYRGETLKERIARGPLPVADAIEVALGVARALTAAHAQGIVHRDVKPGNVMLATDGAVKLLDFGVARAADKNITNSGLIPGTVAYMAPEQARGGEVSARTDLWSLGVGLFEMLTGHRPFGSGRRLTTVHRILHEEPPAPCSLRPDLPSGLEEIVLRLLRKQPDERPATASEVERLLKALRAARGEVEGTAAGPGPDRVPAPEGAGSETDGTPRRRPGRTALVAALVLGAAGMIVASGGALRHGWPPWGGDAAAGLDPQRVAVLPFRVTGADPSLAYLREGLPDLIALKLSGETGPRAVDPQTAVAAWRGAGDADGTELSRDEALSVARDLGTGLLVLGQVVSLPGRVVLAASLYDVSSGGAEPLVSVEGPPDSLPSLVDRLVGGLLSVEAGDAERLASLATSSLPALRLYLTGRAAYRQGRHDEAVEHFARAVKIDSTFALAALMTWRAAVKVRTEAPVGLPLAWRHRDRLGAGDREFLELLVGPNYPDFSSRAAILASRQELVRRQPDNADAWFMLAEWTPHGLMLQGLPDSTVMRRTMDGFSRALVLDSTFLPALEQLWFTARLLGDTAAARRYGDLYLARVPTGLQAETIRCLRAPGFPGMAALPDIVARVDSVGGALTSRCLWWLHFLPEASSLRDAVADHLKGRSHDPRTLVPARRGILQMVGNDRGRPAGAVASDDALLRAGDMDSLAYLATRVRDGLHWDGDPGVTAGAAAALAEMLASGAPGPPRGSNAEALCVLGQWRLARGDVREVAPLVERLRKLDGIGDSFGEQDAIHCSLLLDTWRAARTGMPDTPERIGRLRASLRDGTMAGRHVRETVLVLARLLEERGEPGSALDLIRGAWYLFPLAYNSTFLRKRGRLAALLGDTTDAVDAYRRYLAMRTDPAPALRPEVERVRVELARLVGDPASGR